MYIYRMGRDCFLGAATTITAYSYVESHKGTGDTTKVHRGNTQFHVL